MSTRWAAVALALVAGVSCRPSTDQPPARAAAPPAGESAAAPAPHSLHPEAKDAYERAKQALAVDDVVETELSLRRAATVQGDFTEAWYNLGACLTQLAIAAAGEGRDRDAIALFREAVAAKRTARELMDRNVWWVYLTAEQQAQVRFDVERALEDADEVLANESALLVALRLGAR